MRAPSIIFPLLALPRVAYTIIFSQFPGRVIDKVSNHFHDGGAVPGDSPVRFYNDPTNNLFRIHSLKMIPNPCVIGSYCKVSMEGEFLSSLLKTTPHLSFNVTSHFDDGGRGLVLGEGDFCCWADVFQDDEDPSYSDTVLKSSNHGPIPPRVSVGAQRQMKNTCPPRQGRATINATILLRGDYVPEANYSVAVNVTVDAEKRTLFSLWTEYPLRHRDGAGMERDQINLAIELGELKRSQCV